MRIHRLELAGIGPFRGEQVIDFDRLASAGIFLVEGPTGAGKSTLIDAVVFALFGTLSGSQSDPARIRSDHCLPDEPSSVTLEFSVQGVRHRARRTPSYSRPKLRGEGTTEQRATQVLEVLDSRGEVVTALTAADEIGRHIRDLLGMTADQFRQLVVLPQGEFDALLRMRPAERLDALAQLLGNPFYEQLQSQLQVQATAGRAERERARGEIREIGSRLQGVVLNADLDLEQDVQIVIDDSGSDEERVAALQAIVDSAHVQQQLVAGEQARLQAWALDREQAYQLAQKRVDALDAVSAARAALTRAAANVDPADLARLSDPARYLGELRQLVGALESDVEWEAESANRELTREQLVSAAAAARVRADEAITWEEGLPHMRAGIVDALDAVAAGQREIQVLEVEVKAAERTLGVFERLRSAERELSRVRQDRERLQGHLDACSVEWREAKAQFEELQHLQASHSAAVFAMGLRPDTPCPVCGSCEHPDPARVPSQERLDIDLEAIASHVENLQDRFISAQESLAGLLTSEQVALADRDRLLEDVGDDDASVLQERVDWITRRLVEVRELVATEPDLRARLTDLDDQARTASIRTREASEQANLAAFALSAHEAADEQRSQDIAQRLQRLDLKDCTSATEATVILTERIGVGEEYAEAAAALALVEAAAGGVEVAEDEARSLAHGLKEEAAQARSQAEEAAARLGRLMVLHANLVKVHEEFVDAMAARVKVDDETTAIVALADLVTAARGSANQRKLTLASFAVRQRFRSVLEAATIHLDRMSAGKYELVLEDAARGNQQSGLGIGVIDSWTGRKRDPRTLSGGETFYVSLALALGLADVVRDESGGVAMETLFVDEGFGSLDQETLNLVLEQLDHLRSGGRVIGVVSHVTEMKEWLHDRIEVVIEPDRTSSVRVIP